jgi:RNA polymerase sigma factor (sigma-70 family)
MTKEQFENEYYPKYQATIVAIARRLAKTDHDLFGDLCQEGALALWRCKPERANRSTETYITQTIKYRMIDYLRKHRKGDSISIDLLDSMGVQVATGRDGPRVIRHVELHWKSSVPDEEE